MTADRITGDIRTTLSHDSAHKHVAGSAVYVDDIPTTDDTLVVLIGQSPHAHARISKMDLSADRSILLMRAWACGLCPISTTSVSSVVGMSST